MMLQFREFEAIGKDRASLETMTPFLIAGDPKNQSAAVADCENHLSLDLAVLANLLIESGHTLPIERDAALAVGGYVADANTSVFAQARAYAERGA